MSRIHPIIRLLVASALIGALLIGGAVVVVNLVLIGIDFADDRGSEVVEDRIVGGLAGSAGSVIIGGLVGIAVGCVLAAIIAALRGFPDSVTNRSSTAPVAGASIPRPSLATVDAGWYHDPADLRTARYWDGATWTTNVTPCPPAAGTRLTDLNSG